MATPTRGSFSRPLNTPYGRFCIGNGWSAGIGKKQGTEKSHAKTPRRKGKSQRLNNRWWGEAPEQSIAFPKHFVFAGRLTLLRRKRCQAVGISCGRVSARFSA